MNDNPAGSDATSNQGRSAVPRLLAILGKTLVGLAVFSGTVAGWAAMQHRAAMHEPLPGAGGRQGACVVWFVGSSSFFRWTGIARDMQPWIVHNRGVGGALLPELRQRFANEGPVTPPQAIVFYAGDNDIAMGMSEADTEREFEQFVANKMAKMPRVPLIVLSIKASPTRWEQRPVQQAFNRSVARIAAATPTLTYADASAGLLVGGRPGPFFVDDGIHLNDGGYRVWSTAIHGALERALPAAVVDRCTRDTGHASRP